MGGDGQVTMGPTVVKANAKKVRIIGDGKVLAGFAGAAADAGAKLDALVALPCYRAVQRMSEEIGEAELERFAALAEQMEREIGALIHAGERDDAAKTAG